MDTIKENFSNMTYEKSKELKKHIQNSQYTEMDIIKETLTSLTYEEITELKKYIQKQYIAKEKKRQCNKRYQAKIKQQKNDNE